MTLLHRITTDYDEAEDRIKLVGQYRPDKLAVIWLTQRLLRRLVPVLLERLQTAQPVGQSIAASVVQEFAQQAARAQMQPLPSLQAPADAEAWLVKSIDIGNRQNGLQLVFKGANGEQATLKLEGQFLRHWLNILYDVCRKAGWPLNIWPDWMRESSQAPKKQVVKH